MSRIEPVRGALQPLARPLAAAVSSLRPQAAGLRSGVFLLLLLPGCTSPPAVIPLLEVTRRTLDGEAQRLAADAERDAAYFAQSRATLEEAYQLDLTQRETLDTPWVAEATAAYVAAREELVRAEARAAAARAQRADNLRAAAEAQGRAMGLLEQQDRWLNQQTDRAEPSRRARDLWQWQPPTPALAPGSEGAP